MIHLRLTEAEATALLAVCLFVHDNADMDAIHADLFEALLSANEKLLDVAQECRRGHDTLPIRD